MVGIHSAVQNSNFVWLKVAVANNMLQLAPHTNTFQAPDQVKIAYGSGF